MKLKFNHAGKTHEIALSTTKPVGKSLAIRHNGQIFYASLIAADNNFSTGAKLSIGGQVFSLSKEPVLPSPDGEYTCEVPNTEETFELIGLSPDLGILILDGIYIKTVNGTIVGTFENGVITLFDEALPYEEGTVELTNDDYALIIAEKNFTPGGFTDVSSGTIEYTTTRTLDHYEISRDNTYNFVAGSGGETFRLSGLNTTVKAANAENFISVDEDVKQATFIQKPGSSITLAGNDCGYRFIMDSGVDSMGFTGTNSNDTIEVRSNYVTLSGGAGNDNVRFTGSSTRGLYKFGDGLNSVNYSSNLTLDFTDFDYSVASWTLDGPHVVCTIDDDNKLTVLCAKGKTIWLTGTGSATSTVVSNTNDPGITYNSTRKSFVTLNGSANNTPFSSSTFIQDEYYTSTSLITAEYGANGNQGIYIEGSSRNSTIYSYNGIVKDYGNTIDGGLGNDNIYLNETAGIKERVIFRANQGNDYVYNFHEDEDEIQILDAAGDIVPYFSGTNFVLRVGSTTLTLIGVFADKDTFKFGKILDDFGEEIPYLSGCILNKSNYTISKDSDVIFTSNTSSYTFVGNEKKINATNATYSVNIDTANAPGKVTIEGYKPAFKITDSTNASLSAADIYFCSYDEGTITLGLGRTRIEKTLVLKSTSDQLSIGNYTYYVGENKLYNGTTNATSVTITAAYADNEFNATDDNHLNVSGYLNINASKTHGITLIGGQYSNYFVGSEKSDSLVSMGNIRDTFYYTGGHDTIANYNESIDSIYLDKATIEADEDSDGESTEEVITPALLNLSEAIVDAENNVSIGGYLAENSLVIKNANANVLTFNISGTTENRIYSTSGKLSLDKTHITLSGGHGDFNLPTSTISGFASISTIYANAASAGAVVSANTTISSFLKAGNRGVTLVGGSGNDTLSSGKGDSSLVGGKGSNTFNVAGGNATISDYTSTDTFNLKACSMRNISAVEQTSEGLLLTFYHGSKSRSVLMKGISANNPLTVNGTSYTFNLANQAILSNNGANVMLLEPNQNIDIATYSTYPNATTVLLQNGGTITAATSKAATIGGYNVNLIASSNNDTFLYAGSDMTIKGYGVGGSDRISLASGYTIADSNYDDDRQCPVFKVVDSGGNENTIYLEDYNPAYTSVRITNSTGADRYVNIVTTSQTGDAFNNTENPAASSAVTVRTHFGDFGVISDNGAEDSTHLVENGPEYYAEMYTIEASKQNTLLIGNQKNNWMVVRGGTKNVLIGGLGSDTFVFESGGGVIHDFGIGATKRSDGYQLARTPDQAKDESYIGYNRKDPTSYFIGFDALRVNGTIVEIAFEGYGNAATTSYTKGNSIFTAYVTYIADMDDEEYTIALDNILKKPTKTNATNLSRRTYQTDDIAAKSITLYDTSSGEMKQLSATSMEALFTTLKNSLYIDNITALASFINTKNVIPIDLEYVNNANGKPYVTEYEDLFDRLIALYRTGIVTNNTTLPPAT